MFVAALLSVVAIYAAFIGWCAWRTDRPTAPRSVLSDAELPGAAILVAARDEEATIGRCLDALLAQDYPVGRLTIIVADDHSRDRTAEIVQMYAGRRETELALAGGDTDAFEPEPAEDRHEIVYLRVPDGDGSLRGKALAIHAAAGATDAPVLLVTDADCAPPPGWARAHAESLALDGVGLTAGLTAVASLPERPTTGAQHLDASYLLGVGSALTEAGIPATAMGNNMAFRRQTYDDIGGYPALPFSVTEDYALFQAVAESDTWAVRFPLDPATTVVTLPLGSVKDMYQQRRRWARGGMDAGLALYAVYTLAHLIHLGVVVGLVVAPPWGAGALAIKVGLDAWYLSAVQRRAIGPPDGRLGLRRFLVFEAFLFGYMITLPTALLLRPRIHWKGRVH